MHTARIGATDVLLQNGKVLIVGGWSYPPGKLGGGLYDYYVSAEVYDPATGRFSPTGSMSAARAGASATVLANGRVLIAGGSGCSNPKRCINAAASTIGLLTSAELYDPATGKFSQTGATNPADGGPNTGTLLPDGRVLVTHLASSAELYDPNSGEFSLTGKGTVLSNASFQSTATLLPNGKVLMTGDLGSGGTVAQLYDEASGTFTTISLALPPGTPTATYEDMAIVHRYTPNAALLLKDGRVLLFENGYLETYDPATGVCADAGFISPGGQWSAGTANLLPDGSVLLAGGSFTDPITGAVPTTNTALLYDPAGRPIRTGSLQVARDGDTATLLPDGSVLIAGGEDTAWNAHASAELFRP
jgi:hypothetical protein